MLVWWRTWHDDKRRVWAERQMTGDPADGKRHHAADKQWRWVTTKMHAPAVSPLEFVDENGRASYIASGFVRELDADRQFNTGATHPATQPTTTITAPAPTTTTVTDDDLPF